MEFNADARQIAVFSLSRRGIRFDLLNLKCQVLESIFVEFDSTACVEDAGTCYSRRFEEILNTQSRKYVHDKVMCIGISLPGVQLENRQCFSMSSTMNLEFSEASIQAFEKRMGIPVFVANSSVCLAYAEKKHLDSVGKKPVRDLIYINISDGLGAAIVSHGDIFVGPHNIAGKIGHMTIDYHGKPCVCGSRGCLERYVNLNVILESAQHRCAALGLSAPESIEKLAEMYHRVPELDIVLREVADQLSYGIYSILCAVGIQNIALGGGIEALGEGFLKHVRENLVGKIYLLPEHLKVYYAEAGIYATSVGFAHYYLDKAFTVTY